tara:strand:- start:75 stop:1220 length:1146 start_codon:yes stop_codon:yes gene_type:complete
MIIDYKNLISKYDENLLSKLRGFGEEEFLKFWVPDSEKLKSIYNLIDALVESQTFNAELINLDLAEEEKKDLEKLLNIAINKIEENKLILNIDKKKYIDFKKENKKVISGGKKVKDGKILSRLDDLKYDESISEKYNEIERIIKKLNFNDKKIKQEEKDKKYILNLSDNLKLEYYINIDSGVVTSAFHNSKKIDKKSIILDILCDQIINKGILEVADHAAIYVEHFLRSKIENKNEFGIFLPRNSGGIFNLIEKNLRLSRDDFYNKTNFEKKDINKEYKDTSKDWIKLSFENQKAKIDKILEKNVFRQFNINSSDIILKRVIQGNRLEFILSDNLKGDFEDNKLFKIEQVLKEKIDSSIELLSIEEKDSNKLRLSNAPKAV